MRYILLALAFVAAYSLASTMSYNDAVQAENTYTQMVCDGLWPDYKNLNVECDK